MDKLSFTFPLLLLLTPTILLLQNATYTNALGDLCSSSCGDIRNIRYPFRLKTGPVGCGDDHLEFEISCDDNVPMLIYSKSERYYVRSINYNNFTIRLSDASLVPLPNNNTFLCNHSHALDQYTVGKPNLIIMSCASPLAINWESYKWRSYADGAICSSSVEHARGSTTTSSYWYAAIAADCISVGDVEDSCRVELMLQTSKPLNTIVSFHDVLERWSYGFEVSWLSWFSFPSSPRAIQCRHSNKKAADLSGVFTLFGLVQGLFLITAAPMIIAFAFLYCKWRRRHRSYFDSIEVFLQSTCDQLKPIRYSYGDIKKITKGLKTKLGQGGYGGVYKGKLRSGQLVAVKMLGNVDTNGEDFTNEVATIGRVHHFNVVRLIGFCAEGSKRALVYPLMPNGSLEKYIFSKDSCDVNSMPTVSDEKMYEIALGVARGIEYLHQGCQMQILHFDIKPHNILLDENFVPKVADFGLAKLYPTNESIVSLTAVKGTLGYMAPEFFYKSVGGISYKADVYSFGRMLMEMAARKKDPSSPAVNSSQIFLPSWVHDQFSQGNDIWLGDNTEEEKEIRQKMMMVGLWCVQLTPVDRPSMHKVVEMLQGRLDALQLPPKPSFAPPFLPMNIED